MDKKRQQGYFKKIAQIIKATLENPFKRIGKPEALKYKLIGKWSRRISGGDRLIYEIKENVLYVYSLKGHYQ